MNIQEQLKVQAYLDGELSGRDAEEVAERMSGDQEAQTLRDALAGLKALMVEAEGERSVPETREFYWGKIERRLEQPRSRLSFQLGWFTWRRFWIPAAGMALVAVLSIAGAKFATRGNSHVQLAEVVNLAENTSSISFRDNSQNMFVVWVYDRPVESMIDSEATLYMP